MSDFYKKKRGSWLGLFFYKTTLFSNYQIADGLPYVVSLLYEITLFSNYQLAGELSYVFHYYTNLHYSQTVLRV